MSAPQRPVEQVEEPRWATPPPEPPVPVARWLTLLILIVAAAVVAWVWFLRDAPAPEEPSAGAADPSAAEAEPPPAEGEHPPASAEEPPAADVDPRLAELRASDRFVAFAEHERAAAAAAAGEVAFGWNAFAVIHDREVTHEWTNKAELWDEVVPPIRDELLLLGEPYTEPMWDEERPSHNSIRASWPNDVTGGRGQYVEISGRYFDEERGTPVELNWAVMIATHEDGTGEVVRHMSPIEMVPSLASSFVEARRLVTAAAWEWVMSQPVLEESA